VSYRLPVTKKKLRGSCPLPLTKTNPVQREFTKKAFSPQNKKNVVTGNSERDNRGGRDLNWFCSKVSFPTVTDANVFDVILPPPLNGGTPPSNPT